MSTPTTRAKRGGHHERLNHDAHVLVGQEGQHRQRSTTKSKKFIRTQPLEANASAVRRSRCAAKAPKSPMHERLSSMH